MVRTFSTPACLKVSQNASKSRVPDVVHANLRIDVQGKNPATRFRSEFESPDLAGDEAYRPSLLFGDEKRPPTAARLLKMGEQVLPILALGLAGGLFVETYDPGNILGLSRPYFDIAEWKIFLQLGRSVHPCLPLLLRGLVSKLEA